MQLNYKKRLEVGMTFREPGQETHATNMDKYLEVLKHRGPDSSLSPALKGQHFPLDISRLLLSENIPFLSKITGVRFQKGLPGNLCSCTEVKRPH